MTHVAIFCNDTVPDCGLPNGAQGLRAFGLYEGLRLNGLKADIVIKASVLHERLRRWGDYWAAIPEYVRLINAEDFNKIINRDYDIAIALNWPSALGYEKSNGTKLIYDFFSPTQVEHSFIMDSNSLHRNLEKKLEIVNQADAFIANGIGRAKYGTEFLEKNGFGNVDIPSVRLALPRQKTLPQNNNGPSVFLGGYQQAWTDSLDLTNLIEIAREIGFTIHAVGVGQNLHLDVAPKIFQEARELRLHDLAKYDVFSRLNAQCDLAIDIFEKNEERLISYSTRSISSICSNCPVIHMDFTEIGGMLNETGAGWTISKISSEETLMLLKRIMSDSDELRQVRANTRFFWEQYCDPKAEARKLLEVIK